jgi:glycosyltransferase involved in cell wall biosynthesis
MIRLSLVIPYHSNKEWLFECVESAVNQTAGLNQSSSEVIVIDDSGLAAQLGEDLKQRFGTRAPVYIKNEKNLGIGATWNKAIAVAKGSLVCLLHADDRLNDGYCSEALALQERHPKAAVYFTGADVIDHKGRTIVSWPELYKELRVPYHEGDLVLSGERALAQLCKAQFVVCPTIVYHRALLGPGPYFREDLRQVLDFDFLARLLLEGHELVGRPYRRLYQFRRSGQSQTDRNSKDLSRYDEERRLMFEIADRARAMGWADVEREAKSLRLLRLHAVYRALRSMSLRPLLALRG